MEIELYEHNKKAHQKVLEHFKKSNRTCIIHATGTGKSFVALKFLYDNRGKKCLFLCPTHAIKNQFINQIEDVGLSLNDFPNLEFRLYLGLNDDTCNTFDCIVLDEFHRAGAEIWGKNLKKY